MSVRAVRSGEIDNTNPVDDLSSYAKIEGPLSDNQAESLINDIITITRGVSAPVKFSAKADVLIVIASADVRDMLSVVLSQLSLKNCVNIEVR